MLGLGLGLGMAGGGGGGWGGGLWRGLVAGLRVGQAFEVLLPPGFGVHTSMTKANDT